MVITGVPFDWSRDCSATAKSPQMGTAQSEFSAWTPSKSMHVSALRAAKACECSTVPTPA